MTRTTEGLPSKCPVCGKSMSISPGEPLADVVCPHCGVLFYPELPTQPVPDDLAQLAALGVTAETDDEGEITRLQFNGLHYTDSNIPQLALLRGVPVIDIRHTSITKRGAERLRLLLPDAVIEK